MDKPDDLIPLISAKIKALEPENASKIIEYLLLQEMTQAELLRLAFGPNSLIQEFCGKAKSEMDKPDDLIPLIIAKIKALEPENASKIIEYLLLQDMNYAELFPMAFGMGPYLLLQEFCRKAKSEIAQPQQQRMIAARGSPMSNIQGSRQFGVEEGGLSPAGSHERKDLDSKELFFAFVTESSFTYEDVSAYFSKFGPVEDVKIPYQKQRRYGSVVFAKAETVRTVLARDNPHFICGSIVRLKPSNEKGKIILQK